MTSSAPGACRFCVLTPDAIVAESPLSLAVRDRYPVARGHTLVVPKRHVRSVFDLTPGEWSDLWSLVRRLRGEVEELRGLDANVGLNDGEAAGQTVDHAHVHIIPRTAGDVSDPRGGIRWVLPERADYWSARPDDAGP
jgi:diadenosine tetraphosphate (Ap4A) HIT family hydrolase